jgi:hypothetical protein
MVYLDAFFFLFCHVNLSVKLSMGNEMILCIVLVLLCAQLDLTNGDELIDQGCLFLLAGLNAMVRLALAFSESTFTWVCGLPLNPANSLRVYVGCHLIPLNSCGLCGCGLGYPQPPRLQPYLPTWVVSA